jgi:hypothetical protein
MRVEKESGKVKITQNERENTRNVKITRKIGK